MITFPNAKINLGLQVLRKRNDGFHDIDTVFYPVPLHDSLEILPAGNDETSLKLHGIPISGGDNLCMKAYYLLKRKFDLPPVEMHLLKGIPAGAGLGGGSSDAAHTLLLLNDMFGLGLSTADLERHASMLGSDCPYFVRNRPAHARGRGDLLKDLDLSLKGKLLAIADPGLSVSTSEAYAMVRAREGRPSVADLIRNPLEEWKGHLVNDFEVPVFEMHPQLQGIKDFFYRTGAIYASMSGSGSCVYGIYGKLDDIPGTRHLAPGTRLFLCRFQ